MKTENSTNTNKCCLNCIHGKACPATNLDECIDMYMSISDAERLAHESKCQEIDNYIKELGY